MDRPGGVYCVDSGSGAWGWGVGHAGRVGRRESLRRGIVVGFAEKRPTTMSRRSVKARCRCGEMLTIVEAPGGFKTVCASCGAVVRVRAPAARHHSRKRGKSVAVTCICGQVFEVPAGRVGHRVKCPQCEDRFRVPPPGERVLGMYHTEVIQATDEIPVAPEITPTARPVKPQ